MAHWIIENMPDATDKEIKELLNAVICRCTGYKQILEAVRRAREIREGST